jgi:hypothetical protein
MADTTRNVSVRISVPAVDLSDMDALAGIPGFLEPRMEATARVASILIS